MLNSLQQLSVDQKPVNWLGNLGSHYISQPLFGRGIMYGKLGAQDQNIKDSVAETEPQLRRYFQK
jgi:hypothetical protein